MTTTSVDRRHEQVDQSWQFGVLAISVLAVAIVSLAGQQWTDTGRGSWYGQLDKPSWTPPGAVFGIVWTALYLAMAVAAWMVARKGLHRDVVRQALGLYAVQLVWNLGWTAVFFRWERLGWALAEIGVLFILVCLTTWWFFRITPSAGMLLVPYATWVAYAASLNLGIVVMN